MSAFWTQRALEPKRQYRFTLELATFPDMKFMVKSVNKPEITIEPKTHNYLNHEFHYPGRPKWNAVTAKIIDAAAPDASYRLSEILKESGYIVPNNSNEVTTISKAAAGASLGGVIITQYGPSRTVGVTRGITQLGADYDSYGPDHILETWTLNNPFLTKINYGTLDYANEEMVEIEMEFRYDWATIEAPNAEEVKTKIWSK